MEKIKIIYRNKLNLSRGKISSQCVHAALTLNAVYDNDISAGAPVVVLGMSESKYNGEKKSAKAAGKIVVCCDQGKTEVEAGTETCFAYLEAVK